jgi:hypothetical protein
MNCIDAAVCSRKTVAVVIVPMVVAVVDMVVVDMVVGVVVVKNNNIDAIVQSI